MAERLERVPPHSLEAESGAIGAVLYDPKVLDVVANVIEPRAFYAPVHEMIFRSLLDLASDNRPIDRITLGEALRKRGVLERVGGAAYLSSLMDTVGAAANAEYYARIVAEKAQLREFISLGTRISEIGYNGEDDVSGAAEEVGRLTHAALSFRDSDTGGISQAELLKRAVRRMGEAAERTNIMETPWGGLNDLTGGAGPGECWVIAAPPGVGKTFAAIQLIDFVSSRYGHVASFPLEMGEDATIDRKIGTYARVQPRQMRRGTLTDAEHDAISDAIGKLEKRAITWFTRQTRSVVTIRRELRRLAQQQPLKAVVIDHAGFIAEAAENNTRRSKHETLDRIYTELVALAGELGFWLILVQHINREGSKAAFDGKMPRPTKQTLRDGGNLEGIATTIVFAHRDYPEHDDAQIRRDGEFIIAKSRFGTEGRVPMDFQGHRGLWLERYPDGRVQRPFFEEPAPFDGLA